MNLDEIEKSLPNGLHDAEVEAIHHDVLGETLTLQLFVWVGSMRDPPSLRERYRHARLGFTHVEFCAISPARAPQAMSILTAEEDTPLVPPESRHAFPKETRYYGLYFGYSEMTIAARGVSFEWTEEGETLR